MLIDLFSDGLMIGVGSVVSFSSALVLAIGQVTAEIPESLAAIAIFRDKGVARFKRLILAASFVVAALLGPSIRYWLLRDQSRAIELTALAFTAGLLVQWHHARVRPTRVRPKQELASTRRFSRGAAVSRRVWRMRL